MKKFRLFLFALLAVAIIAGVSYGHSVAVNPYASEGSTVVVPVYAAAALDAGDVVVWSIDASTGDNDLWVASTSTVDTHIVAGVVMNAIVAGGNGFIAIYGVTSCDTNGDAIDAASPICTSSTAGAGTNCGDDSAGYAISVAAIAGGTTTGNCFVQP